MTNDEILKLDKIDESYDVLVDKSDIDRYDKYHGKIVFFSEKQGFCKISKVRFKNKRKKIDSGWVEQLVIKDITLETTDEIMDLTSYVWDVSNKKRMMKAVTAARTQFKKYRKQLNLLTNTND